MRVIDGAELKLRNREKPSAKRPRNKPPIRKKCGAGKKLQTGNV